MITPRIVQAFQIKVPGGTYDEYYRILHADGNTRWIHDRAFPVSDEMGSTVRVVGAAEDVTDRRQVEAQLRQAQKMEAIGNLTGGLAHDFNNLLSVIIGSLDLAKPISGEATKLPNWSTLRSKAALSGAELTRRLLAFARQQSLQPTQLDLNALVANTGRTPQSHTGPGYRVRARAAH